ncbi:aminotransferase-like domain-containing protein [Caproiciproducens sp.]|uniref:aminotransferase-like domain-containing protein n=1 Tax=Caproiciproducens sp. TaxID=1954376 RepID=UPI00289BAC7B|nr:PLP-dependent aminotransferase family protein [Caproiciproducens sp.]
MEYQFSDRVLSLKPSAIREIFKYASDPSVISLSAGNPAPEAFPIKEISEISARILSERPIDALQYSITEGYTPLREHLAAYMKSTHGVGRDFDNILITSGAQQVMDLAAKSLCNEGDVVICEAPSFIGSLNTFRSYNARLRGIPMESDGMDMVELEKALKEETRVKFIYTIPNFQNPSGITMSWEKRRQLYALAKKYGVLILEDNPYGDLRFYGEHIEAIKSLDEEGIVIYAGTFSKVISPGMRVGYAIAPRELLQKMIVCKQGEDVHTNIWSQIVCHELMTRYDFDAHLKRLREVYLKKSAIATGALDKYLAPKVTYNPIEGGLFLWCTLPDGIDMPDFCKQAVLRKVCVVPGNAFLTDENKPCQSFRINFSTPTDIQLLKGIQILGQLANDIITNEFGGI